MRWFQIHPKVKGAFFGFLLVAFGDATAQVTNHYPKSPYLVYAQVIIPVISGFLARESKDA